MKVIIAGSRTLTDESVVVPLIEDAVREMDATRPEIVVTEWIVGGARGVDELAWQWALWSANGEEVVRFDADWTEHGKAAGPIRNAEMVREADALILVWDGKSRGSADVKRRALAKGIPVFERIVTL